MHALATRIETPLASKYLQQLCKHWSHRFEVTFTQEHGTIAFSDGGVGVMSADKEALHIRVEGENLVQCERLAAVVFQHLQRFAFRDPLPAPAWTAASDQAIEARAALAKGEA